MKLDLSNTGTTLPECIGGNYARPKLTGCTFSIFKMVRKVKENEGDWQNVFTGEAVLWVVLLLAIIGAL